MFEAGECDAIARGDVMPACLALYFVAEDGPKRSTLFFSHFHSPRFVEKCLFHTPYPSRRVCAPCAILRLVLAGSDITKAFFRQLAVSARVLIIHFCLTLMYLLARSPFASLSYIAHQTLRRSRGLLLTDHHKQVMIFRASNWRRTSG